MARKIAAAAAPASSNGIGGSGIFGNLVAGSVVQCPASDQSFFCQFSKFFDFIIMVIVLCVIVYFIYQIFVSFSGKKGGMR